MSERDDGRVGTVSPADALEQLRRRLLELSESAPPAHSESALAREIRALRGSIVGLIGRPESCRSCAIDDGSGTGLFSGGRCCRQRIDELLTDAELAILLAAGRDATTLNGPCIEEAMCPFRSSTGCSLGPGDRPSPCVAFICDLLEAELRDRGDLDEIRSACLQLEELVVRFTALRAMKPFVEELKQLL